MKTKILAVLALISTTSLALAQTPGNPGDNGLVPKTRTFDVNTNYNNTSTESTGVAIAANGNVLIGWEDDSVSGQVDDLEAVWTLFSGTGSLLTSPTTITNFDGSASLTNITYRAFFRANSTPMSGYAAWGPKIKANLFGNGLGMGATAYGFDIDVPSAGLKAIQVNASGANAGDFPAVQLLNNDGTPAGIASGMADADAEPDGDVRIGDWEHLSNGNIGIVGESRQEADLVSRFGGATPRRHAAYRIVTAAGTEVKSYSLVSALTEAQVEIWHGVGVTSNGFAVRFAYNGRQTVRTFDNAGNPTSTNLDIAAVTGIADTSGGGRGDGAGFHGNGEDAYVVVNTGGGTPQVTVLNANGTVRFSRKVADGADAPNSDRV